MKSKRLVLTGFVLALLLGSVFAAWPASAQTQSGYTITWWTTNNGGGVISGNGFNVKSSLGEAVVGEISGGGFTVSSGYQTGAVRLPAKQQIFLPVVNR